MSDGKDQARTKIELTMDELKNTSQGIIVGAEKLVGCTI